MKKKPGKMPVKLHAKPGEASWKVEISGDVEAMWQNLGTQKGLDSDSEIAAFLLKHYRDTEGQQCATCSCPLYLRCLQCPLPEDRPPSPVTHPPVAMETCPALPIPLDQVKSEACDDAEEEAGAIDPPHSDSQQETPLSPKKDQQQCTGSRTHVCPECGSQFARSGGLKVHMRIHTGEKPYVCSECGQAFSQSGQLTVHLRKHKGERPFTCTMCPASFPLAGSLKQHMRVHTGDRPYGCPHCSRRFSYAGDLTVHLRKHSGDRPFLCSDCGKSFAVSSDLSKHKTVHSGHRPYQCQVCHKSFPFLNRLTLHMRTHTGDKPFLCSDCGASFTRASNLTVHRRVHHTLEKPFVCPLCHQAFADSANLSKHKKNKHGKHKTRPPRPVSSHPDLQCVAPLPATASLATLSVTDLQLETGEFVQCPPVVGQEGAKPLGCGDGGVSQAYVAQLGPAAAYPGYQYFYTQQSVVHQH